MIALRTRLRALEQTLDEPVNDDVLIGLAQADARREEEVRRLRLASDEDTLHLGSRWSPMRLHEKQAAYWNSTARYNVVPAGRRTGKTELLKRKVVARACSPQRFTDARYAIGAPTYKQVKRIFWDDMKKLVPRELVWGRPSESDMSIALVNGALIFLFGMDKPERIEGPPLDGIGLDEVGNMRPEAWEANVRPALADRQGWADFTGVPEGRNHYYDLYARARSDKTGAWACHTWTTEEILPLYIGEEAAANEIAQAKSDLDRITYEQEFLASFVTFAGRAYYAFTDDNIADLSGLYDTHTPLVVSLDFNVQPGTAVIAQEFDFGTGVLDEVFIPRDSNTPRVCEAIIHRYGEHEGQVYVHGDPAGGARSSQTGGTDWEIVNQRLRPVFGDRLRFRVDRADPGMKARLNAVNSRCCTADGKRRLRVDKRRAPMTVKDLEGVQLVEGGAPEIDKKIDKRLTHLSDALAYYLVRAFGVKGERGIGSRSMEVV